MHPLGAVVEGGLDVVVGLEVVVGLDVVVGVPPLPPAGGFPDPESSWKLATVTFPPSVLVAWLKIANRYPIKNCQSRFKGNDVPIALKLLPSVLYEKLTVAPLGRTSAVARNHIVPPLIDAL